MYNDKDQSQTAFFPLVDKNSDRIPKMGNTECRLKFR